MAFSQIPMHYQLISIRFSQFPSGSLGFNQFQPFSVTFDHFQSVSVSLTQSRMQEFIDNRKVGKKHLMWLIRKLTSSEFGLFSLEKVQSLILSLLPHKFYLHVFSAMAHVFTSEQDRTWAGIRRD